MIMSNIENIDRQVDRKEFLQLFDGSLPVEQITNAWYDKYKNSNYGAIITFVGVVRDENKIDGLSFDIYEPILNNWFDTWQKKANDLNAIVLMAHSRGDVFNHESSYISNDKPSILFSSLTTPTKVIIAP